MAGSLSKKSVEATGGEGSEQPNGSISASEAERLYERAARRLREWNRGFTRTAALALLVGFVAGCAFMLFAVSVLVGR